MEKDKDKPSSNSTTSPTKSSPHFPSATNIPVPVSDLDDRPHRSSKIKSFSQPLALPSAALKKKQASLDFPITTTTTTTSTTSSSSSSSRAFSHPVYISTSPLTVSAPPPNSDNPNPNPNSGSNPDNVPPPLPEFIAAGGGTGIFKLPVRAPMHPGRPPPLELRPHPLRETQVGSYLRSIVCTAAQLWAATECGVRYWELSRLFEKHDKHAEVRSGDEETAPFRESVRTSPTLCLVVDERRGIVWTGHKDGKIRSWRMEKEGGGGGEGEEAAAAACFKEGLSWHAHRCPVLSLVVTSNGN